MGGVAHVGFDEFVECFVFEFVVFDAQNLERDGFKKAFGDGVHALVADNV